MQEYKQFWLRWNDFAGKSTIREYWIVFAINFLIGALLGGAANGTFLAWIGYVYSLAALIPGIALAIRRLHDVGKSGWYLLWALVPIVGWIFVVIALIGASK